MYFPISLLKNMMLSRLKKKANIRNLIPYDEDYETPIQTFYLGKLFDPLGLRWGLTPKPGIPGFGLAKASRSSINFVQVSGKSFTVFVNRGSAFGDVLNVVDCPGEAKLDPRFASFGWSGKKLLDGYALTCSPIFGALKIKFEPSLNSSGYLNFQLTIPQSLIGRDAKLVAPNGYRLSVERNTITDAMPCSHGELNLETGQIFNFHLNLRFMNTAILKVLSQNPNLDAPSLLFPGAPQAGHTLGKIWMSGDELKISIQALMFLPLGAEREGRPITLPKSESNNGPQSAFKAQNTSLHPYLYLDASSTIPDDTLPLKQHEHSHEVAELSNSLESFVCLPSGTNFGDEFCLNSDVFGGSAKGISPLFGNLNIQFGNFENDCLPYVLDFEEKHPEFKKNFKKILGLLPPGTRTGMYGMEGTLDFPDLKYEQKNLAVFLDDLKTSVGLMNIDFDGTVKNRIVLRKYLFLNLLERLISVEPRTPTDSFAYNCKAELLNISKTTKVYKLQGQCHIPYPDGYLFPLPKSGKVQISAGSSLKPFINILAVSSKAFKASDNFSCSLNVTKNCRIGPNTKPIERVILTEGVTPKITFEYKGSATTFPILSVQDAEETPLSPFTKVIEIGTGKHNKFARLYLSEKSEKQYEAFCFSLNGKFDFWVDVALIN